MVGLTRYRISPVFRCWHTDRISNVSSDDPVASCPGGDGRNKMGDGSAARITLNLRRKGSATPGSSRHSLVCSLWPEPAKSRGGGRLSNPREVMLTHNG